MRFAEFLLKLTARDVARVQLLPLQDYFHDHFLSIKQFSKTFKVNGIGNNYVMDRLYGHSNWSSNVQFSSLHDTWQV